MAVPIYGGFPLWDERQPVDPYAGGWAPFQPRSAALDTIGQGLAGLGAGLLSGRNWGEGLSRGLLAANQGMQQAGQDARRDYYVDQQGRYMQRRMQQEDRQAAREDEATRRKAASIEALAASPPPGVDPQQWRSYVQANPDAASAAGIKAALPEPVRPTIQKIRQGSTEITALVDGQGNIVKELGRGPAWKQGPDTVMQAPKTIDERDDYVLRTGDPSSVEYAQAYYRQYMTPKTVMTDQGLRPIMAPVPPGIRPPAGMAPQGQGAAAPAGGTGMTAGPPIPGTEPPALTPGMRGEAAKARRSLANVESALNQYQTALQASGPSMLGAVGIPTKENTALGTAHTSLLVELKTLFELGVLNGPDYMLMLKTIQDPNSFRGSAMGTEGLVGQLDVMRQKLASARAAVDSQYGPDPATGGGAPAPAPAPQQGATAPSGKIEYRFENGVLVPVTPGAAPASHGAAGRW